MRKTGTKQEPEATVPGSATRKLIECELVRIGRVELALDLENNRAERAMGKFLAIAEMLRKVAESGEAEPVGGKRSTYLGMLRDLRIISEDDTKIEDQLHFFDTTVCSTGEEETRRWLARHEPTRELCRKYRPGWWERFRPTAAQIKRETAKWEREKAADRRRQRRAA